MDVLLLCEPYGLHLDIVLFKLLGDRHETIPQHFVHPVRRMEVYLMDQLLGLLGDSLQRLGVLNLDCRSISHERLDLSSVIAFRYEACAEERMDGEAYEQVAD